MSKLRVFVCESQPVAAAGLRDLLTRSDDLAFAGAATNPAASLPLIARIQPDLVLTDLEAGLGAVFHFLDEVRIAAPRARVLLWVREFSEADSLRALQRGARGVIPRTAPVSRLFECLRSVSRGDIWLENSLVNLLRSVAIADKEMIPRT